MRLKIVWVLSLVSASIVLVAGAFEGFGQTPKKAGEQLDYRSAIWSPLHFAPAIDSAKDEQCLECHRDVLDKKPRKVSPAGIEGAKSLAWYQTLSTYKGAQESFHYRHIESPFAKDVMKLSCNFCHRGHNPRDEAPGTSATATSSATARYTLRKVVDPTQTCLRCHGSFPYEVMGLGASWHESRESFEVDDVKNGCLVACHAEAFRTKRHGVTYLKADRIEELAKENSDVCHGCHGGRAWYRNSYPYPRTPWPGMDTEEVPDWAKNRPTQSEARYLVGKKK